VYATDGFGGTSGTADDTETVQNSAPVAGSVAIMPSSPTTNQTLTATPSGFTDADSDTLTYQYQWYKNGNPIAGATSNTLNLATAGNGDRGDVIKVVVYATDGFGGTSGSVNNSVTVQNSAPSLTGGSASVQYSDPLAFTPASSDDDGDTLSFSATGVPSGLQVSQTTGEVSGTGPGGTVPTIPGSYTISITANDGNGGTKTATVTITVNKEDATIDYTGDTIGLTGATGLTLRATVWDSAAAGSGFTGDSTIGDITKMFVQFDIFTGNACGGTPTTTRQAAVTDTGTAGDGIGTATASYTSSSEATYCVVAKLIGSLTANSVNAWYMANPAQAAVITFSNNTGQFVTGGGWIWDPAGGGNKHGNFGFNARYNNRGQPQGQMVYVYRGLYPAVGGVPADYRIKSNSLTTLAFSCWDGVTWTSCPLNNTLFPARATLTGKSTIQINRASDGYVLYSDGNSTFSATVTDSGASSGIGSDSYQLTVYDKNAVLYKSVPTALLQGGNVVIHGGK
jgi:hypothetical protein